MKLKRAVALLMALCMMMGLVPVAAFATEREEHPIIERDTFVTVNIENGGDIAYFRFAPEHTESYTFYSVGDYDTFGHLYDSEMNLLKGNDVGGSDDKFPSPMTWKPGKTISLLPVFTAIRQQVHLMYSCRQIMNGKAKCLTMLTAPRLD